MKPRLLDLLACPACGEYAAIEQPACPACSFPLGDYRQGAAYYLALTQAYLGHSRREAARASVRRSRPRRLPLVPSAQDRDDG